MWLYLSDRLTTRWRAILGTFSLHAIVYTLVLATPFKLEPTELTVVPVVLVERTESILEPPLPVIEAPVELEEPSRENDVELDNEQVQTPDEPAPRPLAEAPVVTVKPARPTAPTVQPSVTNTNDDEAAEAIVIDPRYRIPPDPFAETAPSVLTRVTMATMCNRASLATRPDFCPNITAEDRYFSSLEAPPGWASSEYDPIFEIVETRKGLDAAAAAVQSFFANQPKHGTRSGSPELEPISQVPKHPESFTCTPVQTGLQGPGGTVSGGEEFTLGSSDGIQCR
ncbi:MAG: hypothetical protein AAF583_02585 [Pseudomonadota bacterium]